MQQIDGRGRYRALIAALLSVLAALVIPAAASAVPVVKIKGEAVPIPGFPHTGNILGAGAAVHAELTISGSEYSGAPPPLIGVTAWLPTGVKLHPQGFPTCPVSVILEEAYPDKCPKGSSAGPIGKAYGVVTFGTERVPETAEIFSFFIPGDRIGFLTVGHSPVSLEVPTSGQLENLAGGEGFGPKLVTPIPLVATVPGAPYASVEAINITLGAAYRSHGKTIYYGRVPTKCPRGGFPVRAQLTFAENGETSRPEVVTVNYRAPCPRS
ncbi:MAG TPA: hypothetical protein VK721_14370 [Solirubrobacteraceae bacterium]|jgi:hypothetical protein|nr:hypothetical protein [Solirubrobacteraceae bacterium]